MLLVPAGGDVRLGAADWAFETARVTSLSDDLELLNSSLFNGSDLSSLAMLQTDLNWEVDLSRLERSKSDQVTFVYRQVGFVWHRYFVWTSQQFMYL